MKSKMVGLFALVMIALMVAGFAYAHWSETLIISGSVGTGKLDAAWSIEECWDNEPEAKDYSSVSCEIEGYTLYVTIENAYPSIDYYCLINLENTGTIPLHIYEIAIDRGNLPEGTTLEILPVEGELEIAECTQLHPEEAAWGILHIHLDQDAEELATYTFSITVTVVQWNYP